MLDWKTLVGSRDSKFFVKGTELSGAICGARSRLAVYEVRALEADGSPTIKFRVRDAQTVSDVEVLAGVRPRIVFETYDYDELLAFVDRTWEEMNREEA